MVASFVLFSLYFTILTPMSETSAENKLITSSAVKNLFEDSLIGCPYQMRSSPTLPRLAVLLLMERRAPTLRFSKPRA
jgi:hypothetical protein